MNEASNSVSNKHVGGRPFSRMFDETNLVQFGYVFAAAFLFNHDFILFDYKTKHNFYVWIHY